MLNILGLFAFVFGLIIGSFLNVVILRYKSGRTINGRSFCFSCGKLLGALDLIPLLSFVGFGGKCRHCKSPISWQYPLVEFITGAVFYLVFLKALEIGSESLYSIPYYWFMFSILIIISVYDARHKIVPDMFAFIFASVALLWMFVVNPVQYFASIHGLLDILSGPIFFIPFYLLWRISQGRWMGLGDGKLIVGLGWLLGFVEGASAIVLGFWIAAGVSLLVMFLQKVIKLRLPFLSMRSEVPFAPFLALGGFISYFYSLDILSLRVLLDLF